MPAVLFSSGRPAREHWPLDPATAHLNHGSFGAVPSEVIAHQDALRRLADANPVRWFPGVAERVARARREIAGFAGADPDDTAFVPNASAAATVVYNSLSLRPGDEILVTDHGYGAITAGAARLARRAGAAIVTAHVPLTASDEEAAACVGAALTDRTRLVVVDQITSATARTLPVAAISDLAHARGARVLVDGAHAPGLVPDAAAAVGAADWWFGNLHKWPCAPRGSALLVTRASDRDTLWPLIDSWGYEEPFPGRFDHQGTLDATSYLTSPAAVAFLEREYGWDRARATLAELADQGAAIIGAALQPHLEGAAVPELPGRAPSMRLIRLPEPLGRRREIADGLRGRVLDETGVECAFTSFAGQGYLRLSAHLYTVAAEFEMFAERVVPLLARIAADEAAQQPSR